MASKGRTKKLYRSAKTGHFVKKGYVKKHPDTTLTETVKIGKRKGKS